MSNLFAGGLPTQPDVEKLIEAFKSPDEGRTILHDEIESVIGVKWKTGRYRVVVSAWRRMLSRLHNIATEAAPGVGVKILGPQERVTAGVKRYGRGVRDIGRSVTHMRRVPVERLPTEQQKVAEHATRHMEATLGQARADSRAIAYQFKPQDQLPRARKIA